MPDLAGVAHVALTVTDAPRSAAWYTRVLGLREAARFAEGDGARQKIVLTDAANRVLIGVVQHGGAPADRFDERRTGLDHLSFAVPGRAALDAWAAHLDALGVPYSPIAPATLDPRTAVLVFRDPDHIQLELFTI
ncbi:VOC family protein [Cryptosporangium sp. NPDC051539]|uniref:VOC family protein n=1 Tax=Cryptosporangium sp. NPDC051539 TaxID=3363962 RepID=UPI00378888B3